MSIRQAWAACKALETETSKKDKKDEKYDSDSDDDADPSLRRAALDEFRRRYNYSIPMHHQPSDRLFMRFTKQYEKRLLPCFNLKDVVVILGQEMTVFLTRRLETNTTDQDRTVAA